MKVLITGATGFVGTWLTRDLCQKGLEVRILCRGPELPLELKGLPIEVAHGDITSIESLEKAVKGVKLVFHLAGLVGYSRSMRSEMERVNVQGTANILRAVEAEGGIKLLHMSSVTAIGASFDGIPLNENSQFNLSHLNLGYFETKREAESLVKISVEEGRVDAVIVNPSTIYGAGDALKGSRGTQIKVAKGIFPYYTGGGVNVIAVEDLIPSLWAAVTKGRTGERYILSGENLLIKDLFGIIADEAGVRPPHIFLPNVLVHGLGKVGDILERFGMKGPLNSETAWTSTLFHWFDSSKARNELGLKTRPAREAIAQSIRWMKEQHVIY